MPNIATYKLVEELKTTTGLGERFYLVLNLVDDQKHELDQLNEEFQKLREALAPLVRAARNFVQGDGDKDALERLVEVVDTLPWTALDTLGIEDD